MDGREAEKNWNPASKEFAEVSLTDPLTNAGRNQVLSELFGTGWFGLIEGAIRRADKFGHFNDVERHQLAGIAADVVRKKLDTLT